jgi:transcriptional regulator GlxA family with amidase domain
VLENRIFVEDGPVLTSAGVTAGLDLALHLISRQLGPRIAAEVARDLVVYLRRSGADPALSPWVQHRNHLHPAVHRVQDAVGRQPAASWTSSELAAVACTGSRNLARLFAEHAHCSPLDYVQLIRFAFAKELVAQSKLDLERIAVRAGFSSAQQLRHQRQALLESKLLGAVSNQQHVTGFLHHASRELDGIPHVPHGRYRAGPLLFAFHHRGIELGNALARKRCAMTGVK